MIATLAAMDPAVIATFLAAGIMLNLTPGADVMFASACGLSGGARSGIAAACGVALGSVWHVGLATLGISAAILALPHAHDVLRWGGAAYLLYLAWGAWQAPAPVPGRGTQSAAQAVWRGFVTNALNPKVALFIMAFLPQFTDPAVGPIWQQTLALGALFTATGLAITGAYGAAAGLFGARLGRATGWINRAAAVVFAGLAARIVFDR